MSKQTLDDVLIDLLHSGVGYWDTPTEENERSDIAAAKQTIQQLIAECLPEGDNHDELCDYPYPEYCAGHVFSSGYHDAIQRMKQRLIEKGLLDE